MFGAGRREARGKVGRLQAAFMETLRKLKTTEKQGHSERLFEPKWVAFGLSV